LARFFRGVLWQTAGLAPPGPRPQDPHPPTPQARPHQPEDAFILADRCLQADYYIQRRLALNLILESLLHDLGKVINTRR
jgi:DNA polymerase-3 subunit delta'